jgi:hypothetical protein
MWLRCELQSFGNATLQQEGPDLIDDASVLTDQPLTHAVERLQIELLGGCRDELHCRAPDRLGTRKSFFCPLEYGRTYFDGISRACPMLAAEMVRPDASLHAD